MLNLPLKTLFSTICMLVFHLVLNQSTTHPQYGTTNPHEATSHPQQDTTNPYEAISHPQ
jgi:hypothetical protein